jgi:hypothetical protein
VLDLTEQDFHDISNITGRILEIGVQRSGGPVSTVVCLNSEFLKQDLKGKHSWLNACSAKELSERLRHVLSACVASPLTTSVCVLTRQSMPIDMSLLKDFRCVLTVPKEGLVRQQQEDGSWLVVQSPECLRVLYRPSAADRVSAEAGMLTSTRDSYGASYRATKSGQIATLRTARRTIFVRRAEYLATKLRRFVGPAEVFRTNMVRKNLATYEYCSNFSQYACKNGEKYDPVKYKWSDMYLRNFI